MKDARSAIYTGIDTTSINESDPDGGQYDRRIRIVLHEFIPADPFSIIIGDILFSLRSSLDALVYELNGGTSYEFHYRSEFPIFGCHERSGKLVPNPAKRFAAEIGKRVGGMHKSAQAIVESLQPYHRGNGYPTDPLWRLHSLHCLDKHRTINVVAGIYQGVALIPKSIDNFGGWNFDSTYVGPLKMDTVVIRYRLVPLDPKREVSVNLHPVPGIGFADASFFGKAAGDELRTILDYVSSRVIEPLGKYL